jgi:hypothetical protein
MESQSLFSFSLYAKVQSNSGLYQQVRCGNAVVSAGQDIHQTQSDIGRYENDMHASFGSSDWRWLFDSGEP